uniref:CCHC-type domain-containing protein n=1 Tax=Plectus sambesii TaxID=2011161 RepID=A0A914W8Q4_9BILA
MAETRKRLNDKHTNSSRRDTSRESRDSDRQVSNQHNNQGGNRQNNAFPNGRGRNQGRNSRGSAECFYCGRYGHRAYSCFKNPASPQYKGQPQAQLTYQQPNAAYAITSGPGPQQAITYYPQQDPRAGPTYAVNTIASSGAHFAANYGYTNTHQQQRPYSKAAVQSSVSQAIDSSFYGHKTDRHNSPWGKASTPNLESPTYLCTLQANYQVAPSLHRKRSVDSLTSFYESNEEATRNGRHNNECYSIFQVPIQGNQAKNCIDLKAWLGSVREACVIEKQSSWASHVVQDAGQTSKTTMLEGLRNPATESARNREALHVTSKEVLEDFENRRTKMRHALKSHSSDVMHKLQVPNIPVSSPEKPPKSKFCSRLSKLLTITVVTFIVFNCFLPTNALGVMGNGPMICHSKRHAAFSLPEQRPCPNVEISLSREENVRLALYKHNHVAYQTKAHLCKGKRIIKRVFTFFFDTEHLFEDETQTLTVNEADCIAMINFKTAGAMGSMVKIADRWQTSNDLKWEMLSAGFSCCKWVSFTVDNAYLIKTIVYQKHDATEMETPAADVKHCKYADGKCSLREGEFLMWQPKEEEKCRFLPWKEEEGKKYDKYWMNKEGTMAINIASSREEQNCDGPIMMPTQGLPIDSSRRDKSATLSDGLVTSDQLASQLQAVHLDAIKAIRLTLGRTIHEACQRQIQLTLLALAGIRARPTQTMRQIFNTSQITARCFSMLPMTISQPNGKQRRAFFNAGTNVIHKDALLAPCDTIDHLPVQLGKQTFAYDYRTALSPEGKEAMKELLRKYHPAFCRSNWELSFTNKLTYKLDVGNAQPVTSRPIQIAARLQPVVEEMVREMLERGLIIPSDGVWALPQGLKVSPSLYNRLNQLLFNGILFKFVVAYQDDTIIFSPDEQTHLQHVEEVLRRFLDANLKLKASKCEIAVSSTTFLGVRVDGEGILVTNEKI